MKNLHLINDIKTAVQNRQGADLIKAFNKVSKLPAIIQYYLIKGLKLADSSTYYECFDLEGDYCRKTIVHILTEIYDYKNEDHTNEKAAYDGMGNLDAYVTAIKAL